MSTREYPDHLRPYHELDAILLPWAAARGEFLQGDLTVPTSGSNLPGAGPRWLQSALHRGLVEQHEHPMHRTFSLTAAGRSAS